METNQRDPRDAPNFNVQSEVVEGESQPHTIRFKSGSMKVSMSVGDDEAGRVFPRPEPRPKLIAMVGLPRSGKSTWAKTYGHPIVCPDAIRLALHGQRFIAQADMVWTVARLMVKSLFGAGHRVVVLDACNVMRARRREWECEEWQTKFFHVVTPLDTCLERAAREGDYEIVPVIKRMAAEWESFEPRDDVRLIGRDGFISPQELARIHSRIDACGEMPPYYKKHEGANVRPLVDRPEVSL